MELTNKSVIKNLLKTHNAKPEKYLGQHFILSKNALSKMIEAAEIKKNDIIIEIGPGLGTLTRELTETGARVIAIEKDPLMVEILKETAAGYKNIKIIQADARTILMSDMGSGVDVGHQYKIVANLPYNAATFLIHKWLDAPPSLKLRRARPELIVLMIQKEVAQRICAKPPRANLLAMSVQFYANVEIIDYVKKESFWPKPKVDAAVIKIVPKNSPSGGSQKTRNAFFAVAKAGFSQPRKQLAGNLAKKIKISKENIISTLKNLDISEQARAENLTLEQWISLTSNFSLIPKKRENKF